MKLACQNWLGDENIQLTTRTDPMEKEKRVFHPSAPKNGGGGENTKKYGSKVTEYQGGGMLLLVSVSVIT